MSKSKNREHMEIRNRDDFSKISQKCINNKDQKEMVDQLNPIIAYLDQNNIEHYHNFYARFEREGFKSDNVRELIEIVICKLGKENDFLKNREIKKSNKYVKNILILRLMHEFQDVFINETKRYIINKNINIESMQNLIDGLEYLINKTRRESSRRTINNTNAKDDGIQKNQSVENDIKMVFEVNLTNDSIMDDKDEFNLEFPNNLSVFQVDDSVLNDSFYIFNSQK